MEAPSMKYRDYYQTLGVGKNASDKEIKAAYRKLARQYHPDVNKNSKAAEERFKEINEAYEVLGDPQKRAKYDQLGANWRHWEQAGGSSNNFDWAQWMSGSGGPRANVRYADDIGDVFGGGSFSDFFTSIFGDAGRGSRRRRNYETSSASKNSDVEQELEISLTEAYRGTQRIINKDGQRLEVKIPPGAKTGTKVRVRGQGKRSLSGNLGDLYLKIKVAADPRFDRQGDDLFTDVSVDLYTAVLGGEVLVPTLDGDVRLKIPVGSQNGQKIRLSGRGMPNLKSSDLHGNLYAVLSVRLPKTLSPEERRLFTQLRDLNH
jgi:curved DNA-binding protein